MRSNYKRLGDYIRQVDIRNRDLAVTELQGLSMTKQFRESTSNIIGVDLSKYKIVNPGVFAFDTMSVIRVHRVPIILNDLGYSIIVSPAYVTFEVIDEEILNKDFLFMIFKSSEFDRYADFKSDASVRGGYNWEELCETYIPVPSIEEQRKIVGEYQAVEQRIENNRRLIAKLEETAQIIYRNMFVDNIDPENLPQGWRYGKLGDVVDCFDNKRKPVAGFNRKNVPQIYPYYGATSKMGYIDDFIFDGDFVLLGEDGSVVKENGTPYLQQICGKTWVNNHAHVLKAKNQWNNSLLYTALSLTDVRDIITGGVQLKINQKNLMALPILIPDNITLQKAKNRVTPLDNYKRGLSIESEKLANLLSLLLSKLSKLN